MIWILAAVFIGLLNWYAPADPTRLERVFASATIFVCFWGIRHWRKFHLGREFGFFPSYSSSISYSFLCQFLLFSTTSIANRCFRDLLGISILKRRCF